MDNQTMNGKPILVGLAGVGTVGSGMAIILKRHAKEIEHRIGRPITLYAAGDHHLSRAAQVLGDSVVLVKDIFQLLSNPAIAIVVELIGGTTAALDFVMGAIEQGKHVVTANKALLAKHGNVIFQTAQKKVSWLVLRHQ